MADKSPAKVATSQRESFIEAARKAEADESEAAFEAKLKKIAKAKSKDEGETRK